VHHYDHRYHLTCSDQIVKHDFGEPAAAGPVVLVARSSR
jgi:hypothetical protein